MVSKKRAEEWTPYGLEAIRVGHLRRRRALALLLALTLVGLWGAMMGLTTDEIRTLEITDGTGSSRISIDTSAAQPREDKPLTVSVSPGRVTRAETGGEAAGSQVTRFNVPTFDRAAPIPWALYALMYGPYILVGLALLLLSKRKTNEVNFGIYKGAMPMEMITAAAVRHVYTTRQAHRSLFGKRASDHLPAELVVERMPVEEDA